MLPYRVLAREESLRKRLVDYSYLACRPSVLIGDGPAQHDLRAYSLEEARHHSRKPRTGVFFSGWFRPTLDANSIIPTVSRHRRIKRRRHHPYTGNLEQAFVNLAKHRLHLLRLVVA